MTVPASSAAQGAVSSRDPDRTRQDLLSAAEREIHLHGYQAASLSQIIADAGVTKGALYHHFANKQALGYAVVDELWGPQLRALWIAPLQDDTSNPVDVLVAVIEQSGEALSEDDLILGCPINNLAQEMSPINEGFRSRINGLLAEWRQAISDALARGQQQGFIGQSVQPDAAAALLVASLEGCIGMAKNAQSKQLLMQCGAGVIGYLNTLRA
jgi:AcrR family transcriptional regulator